MKFGIKNRKFFSKVTAIIFVLGLFLGVVPVAYGQTFANVNIVFSDQGKSLNVSGRIVSNTLLVPYQALVENLGGQSQYESLARRLTITKGDTQITITAGSRNATLNGTRVNMPAAPVIHNNQLLVPLRFVAENLDQLVLWNNATRTATLREKPVAAVKKTGGVVNIYTSRHYGVEPVFAEFTKETGITVRFTTGGDALLRERIKAEGKNTPADVYMTVDAGNLWLAAQDGLLQPISSAVLNRNIPAELRDSQNRYFGLTKRVRTIMYHPARVTPAELATLRTYADLADPKWNGRLILRPGTHVYNQSLVANLIASYGEARAERIVNGWMANKPQLIDSDTRILETLAAGGGDVAITNHYYLGRLLQNNPAFPIKVIWADQGPNEAGVHANISGAGITAHAANRENAIILLEWLSSPRGQRLFADSNHEFPANPAVAPHSIIAGFGKFRENPVAKSEFGRLQADAVKLIDRAGFK
ncbi:extracellular solute-binding protein [Desulfitibacter alkalitolerans]|uniref:extracellular solute-binding protein n=1 Tax=Desulfitibacter alkalitolerans TaxID=264641 RepID=UPI000B26BA1E|nr:extracellular solute-binding protein [Desulfitibacter alkalitolerans]